MMMLIIFPLLLAGTRAAPASQSLTFHEDGSYRFYYETGKEGGSHVREETRHPDGVVVGKFSYEDPNGGIREVVYRADDAGYVAEGDVGVQDAPKGKFPADVPAEEPQSAPAEIVPEASSPQEEAKPEEVSTDAVVKNDEEALAEEADEKDDMRDLALEESTADDPPEAFPEGFFVQHFHALRRLPEPTPKEEVATTELPAKEEAESATEPEASSEKPEATTTDGAALPKALLLKPFQHFPPQQWASSMFHQPVYVFSYQQPDSYGYHYYF